MRNSGENYTRKDQFGGRKFSQLESTSDSEFLTPFEGTIFCEILTPPIHLDVMWWDVYAKKGGDLTTNVGEASKSVFMEAF